MEAVPICLYNAIGELVPPSDFSFRVQSSTWREIFHSAYVDIFHKARPAEIIFERSVARRGSHAGLLDELLERAVRDIPNFFKQARQILKPGQYDCFLPPGHGGLLVHEAIGHMLEARPNGLFHGRLGEQVASEAITVIDDPTIPNGFGSFDFDDEGERSIRKTLIKNGRIECLLDRPGNARRETTSHALSPRMSNTYVETVGLTGSGQCLEQQAQVGIQRFGGGRVDHRTGRFELIVREAWQWSGGQQAALLPFLIRGQALELLRNIKAAVGPVALYPSFCRGTSGTLPVSYGQPSMLVSQLECRPLQNSKPWDVL